jgi:hypothetical protein
MNNRDLPPGLAAAAQGRDTLPTAEAAPLVNRQSQTLRKWACKGGPIKPIRIGRRLAWPVDALARLLSGEEVGQ